MFNQEDVEQLETMYRKAVQSLPEVQYSRGYPIYPEAIKAFMDKLADPPWNNFDYNPRGVAYLIENVGNATKDDLRSILTSVHRSERFGDGNWIAMLESGDIDKVIQHARELMQVR